MLSIAKVKENVLKLIQVYGDFVKAMVRMNPGIELKFDVYFSSKPEGDHLFTFDIPFVKAYLIIKVSSSHGILKCVHIDL
ncbi:MAG TPA: hypothetical protein VF399_11985 [bacterium]